MPAVLATPVDCAIGVVRLTKAFAYYSCDSVALPLPFVLQRNKTPFPIYDMRAWDNGTMGFVYWTSHILPNFSPTITSPQFTGLLAGKTVVNIR